MKKCVSIFLFFVPVICWSQCTFNKVSGLKLSGGCGMYYLQGLVTDQAALFGYCGAYQITPPIGDDDFTSSAVDIKTSARFYVYPNPTWHTLTVLLPSGFNIDQLSIFNAYGKHITNFELYKNLSSIEIELSQFQSGYYIVKAYSSKKYLFSSPFIKL